MQKRKIYALYVFSEKGEPGTAVDEVQVVEHGGIAGDMHCREKDRQISILSRDAYEWMHGQDIPGLCFHRFKANLIMENLPGDMAAGTKIRTGDAVLTVTGRKQHCYDECVRHQRGMDCIVRHGCWFASADRDGTLRCGDEADICVSEEFEPDAGVPGARAADDGVLCEPAESYNWNRYKRQMLVPGMGKEQQERLKNASVLVIGAGGLGCPALTVLAEAGIGTLGIMDADVVEETNLNRQYLYTPADIGRSKSRCAGEWVKRFRPDLHVSVWEKQLTQENGPGIISGFDLVVAAVDRVSTRLLINRLSLSLKKPLVDGAIDGYYGTVAAVLDENAPCLACLNPEGKEPEHISSSFGTTTMITGALEAQFAVRYLAGLPVKSGHILSYDGLYGTLDEIPAVRNPACKICGDKKEDGTICTHEFSKYVTKK